MKIRPIRILLPIILFISLIACEESEAEEINGDFQENNLEENTKEQAYEKDLYELISRVNNKSPTNERIQVLQDIAMHYYLYGNDLELIEKELFNGASFQGNYDVVAYAFKQASELDPYNLDLLYALASTKILQRKIPEALETYEEMMRFDGNHFEAQLMHAIYSKVEGNEDDFNRGFDRLAAIDCERALAYKGKLDLLEDITAITFETVVPENIAKHDHAFIVLGYALSEEGEMKEPLIERLKIAKEAAEQYPNSKIIVTGGVPKAGHTEAELMFDWLVENGIDQARIFTEKRATDTVENALLSMEIVKNEAIKDITIISNATHMRRALTIFHEVNELMGKKADKLTGRNISNIVYMDYESEEASVKMTKSEELAIYRDFMRATGIWQFPGLQR